MVSTFMHWLGRYVPKLLGPWATAARPKQTETKFIVSPGRKFISGLTDYYQAECTGRRRIDRALS